jgi:DNA-binding CsgD family transcriptional regulator
MSQILAVAYFIITTAVFLIYGRIVQKMPDIDYQPMTSKIITVFYVIDLLIAFYFSVLTFLHGFKEKMKSKRQYLVRFGFLVGILAILRAASMHFSHYHLIIGLYFILLFFAGNLVIVFLTKVYLFGHSADFQTSDNESSDLFMKYGISNREKEIVGEICKGKTNQQIADDLFISLQTVKDHIYNIFRKVNVKNRVQLTKLFNP